MSFSSSTWHRHRRLCTPGRVRHVATWNVDGFRGDSLVKLEELLHAMRNNSIDILCGQKTHLHGAEYYSKHNYKLFFSGSLDVQNRTCAGVGFLVGPSVVKLAELDMGRPFCVRDVRIHSIQEQRVH
eukprot:669383-Pyramimonas_sp.AAC.1